MRKGITCDGDERYNYTIEECRKCALRGKMLCGRDPAIVLDTLNLIDGYIPTERDRPTLTVTDLTAVCHRKTYLQENYDYWEKPSDLFFLWRGTFVHEILSRVDNPAWIKEKKFAVPYTIKLNGEDIEVYIVMKPDVIDTANLDIRDYKTTGSVFKSTKTISMSYKYQLGCYRWGVKKHYDILCNTYHDTFIDMKQDKMFPIPLMPLEEVEKFIQIQGAKILDFRFNKNIPPVLKGYPHYWMCRDYCNSVIHLCTELHSKEGI